MEINLIVIPHSELEACSEEILAVDRICMAPVLQATGYAFPAEERLRGLMRANARAIAAFEGKRLVGYLSWGPDFTNPDDLYIDSIQVLPDFRFRGLFPRMCAHALDLVGEGQRCEVVTNVQASNARMVRRLRKMGFQPVNELGAKTLRMRSSTTALEWRLRSLRARYAQRFGHHPVTDP